MSSRAVPSFKWSVNALRTEKGALDNHRWNCSFSRRTGCWEGIKYPYSKSIETTVFKRRDRDTISASSHPFYLVKCSLSLNEDFGGPISGFWDFTSIYRLNPTTERKCFLLEWYEPIQATKHHNYSQNDERKINVSFHDIKWSTCLSLSTRGSVNMYMGRTFWTTIYLFAPFQQF